MKQKKRRIWILIAMILGLSGSCVKEKVQAVGAMITMETFTEQIQVGERFTVAVNLKSGATIGEVSQKISYDTELLEFQTETSPYAAEEGVIWIQEEDASTSKEKYLLEFKAIKEGTAKFGIDGTPEIYTSSGTIVSVSSNTLVVEIGEKKETNASCELTALSVKEGKLNRAFTKGQTTYTMMVGKETTKLTIDAKPEDAGSVVEILGADELLLGENEVIVRVVNGDGAKKEYTITVTRSAQEAGVPTLSVEPTQVPEEKEQATAILKDGVLQIGGTKEYEILSLKQLSMLPKGYLSVSLSIDGQPVDAYQLEGTANKEMYLLYAKYKETTAFYMYDSREHTMQRYVENALQQETTFGMMDIQEYNKDRDKLKTMLFVCVGWLCITTVLAVGFYRRSKMR